jgi:NAD+ synthase (glutamine-hydrolysing)
MTSLRLALAQVNPTVGALRANRALLAGRIEEARALDCDVVVFPELALTGYPPEDLLANRSFVAAARAELEALIPRSEGLLAVIGIPLEQDGAVYNAAALLQDGRWIDSYFKGTLPNYGVFDEKRYFRPGLRCPVYRLGSFKFGVNICEDLWTPQGVPAVQRRAGAGLVLNLSSSPYYAGKGMEREHLLRHRARQHGMAIAYVNLVGGQDELVFDGESMAVDAAGAVRARAPQFEEALLVVDVDQSWCSPAGPRTGAEEGRGAGSGADPGAPALPGEEPFTEPISESIDELESQFYPQEVWLQSTSDGRETREEGRTGRPETKPPIPASHQGVPARLEEEAEIYRALCLGVRDYVRKNGFTDVIIGLSGGIDSALTAAVAADALGPAHVGGVSMPSRYNSASSRRGAEEVARNLGIRFREIPIDAINQGFLSALGAIFGDAAADVTEENLQARIRGTLLMALSNKWGHLVLTTGNKSEVAVGYCTLYGDMAGGFAVIQDVPKTLVYRLARHRNTLGAVIPEDTLHRPPSAELRENQTDQDLLPPYDLLDRILEARLEREEDLSALIAQGVDPKWAETIYRWIDASEYKRRQAPPGIKITPRAFGRDRRYPITNHFRWKA